jgi:hypothetical protein
MISDYEIDQIISVAAFCYVKTKIFKDDTRYNEFLNMIHVALHNTQSGTIKGACKHCFGTGYEDVTP